MDIQEESNHTGSITYITNRNMVEYHRLHSNPVINFWKPSIKNIIDFKKGDMLFFSTKGAECGKKREEGIFGHGHPRKQRSMGFTQMRNIYKTLGNYPDKESLKQTICKIAKQEEVPELLSCMGLENAIYLQYPIYLSEIGTKISNNIESSFHIDKEDIQNTGRLLHLASFIGTDTWVSSTVVTREKNIQENAVLQILESLSRRIEISFYPEYRESKIRHYIQKPQDANIQSTRNSKTEHWVKRDGKIMILLPCLSNFIDVKSKMQYSIGHYQLLKVYINQSEHVGQVSIKLLFNQKIHSNWRFTLSYLKIGYEGRLVEEGQPYSYYLKNTKERDYKNEFRFPYFMSENNHSKTNTESLSREYIQQQKSLRYSITLMNGSPFINPYHAKRNHVPGDDIDHFSTARKTR